MTKNQQILAKMGGGSLALLLSLGLGQQASATTLVSNLPPITSDPTTGSDITFNQWVRSSFKTGSISYGYTLNSVTLLFRELTANNSLFVRLHRDDAGDTGALITTFNNPSPITSTAANNNFSAPTPQTLAADTTYWLVAGISSNVSGGQYRWARTNSVDQGGELGWSIGDSSLFSINQGGTWSVDPAFKAFQFSVNGTVNTPPTPPTNIPEPGSAVALLGLGGLGLASRMKKLSTRA
ncbi:choice-of-anchor R domain-containing protein [Microcystis aeruginosa]|uniref:Ice-binding protein C-terminal domain-containing protein n=1 Tax=Microcystis aeruginosa NIES-3807 TaxID=2517785 RepID=A0AAD3G9A2_MICAE|nr:choice-of-anchor R domain-containing protein [Microcystis aeruginosa]GCL59525.1 hypothetical protein NIES3807_27010 [Microcystis aeruginosa NIES-3807]